MIDACFVAYMEFSNHVFVKYVQYKILFLKKKVFSSLFTAPPLVFNSNFYLKSFSTHKIAK